MTKGWTLFKNGNFTKLLILILLGYALGDKAIQSIAKIPIP